MSVLEFKEIAHEFEFAGAKCSLSTGKYARRAGAAVIGKMGGTVVLATVDVDEPNEGIDYFPLGVEYIERMYAGGVISSSRFIKREGRPSDSAILAARMVDRSIRCRFPDDYRNGVQAILTVLSYDPDYDPILIGFSAISAALMLSKAPFKGPIAGIRVGLEDEKLAVCNKDLTPNGDTTEVSDMNVVLGSDGELVTMLDADASEMPEEKIIEAMRLGVEESKALIEAQKELISKYEEAVGPVSKPDYESAAVPKDLLSLVRKEKKSEIEDIMFSEDDRGDKEELLDQLKSTFYEENEGTYSKSNMSSAIDYVSKELVKKALMEEKRTDGRKMDEIRPLDMEVGVLPRAHGSGLFSRGMTQALTVTTLGSSRLAQLTEGMEGEGSRRYMHHYNAPNYTFGRAGRYSYYPGRREIGHGALAEKALLHVIPSEETFPYTIRVVSEVMSQAGSSSMASVCGSTLSLMDAGVPVSAPVAGIAMGVVMSDDLKDFKIMVDIADWEDFYGDMDFKVAGTRKGVTAVQMDNKKDGLPVDVFEKAIDKAKEARFFLLDEMDKVISEPRVNISEYAPKIEIITVSPDKVGEVIGPGGKVIKGIIEETGVEIDIKDDGKVCISSTDEEQRQRAVEMVESIVMEPEVGKVYKGKVDKIMDFGAFVNVSPGISGLVHISEMSNDFVKDPHDIVKEGETVEVKIIGFDDKGRVKMSMKAVSQKAQKGNDKGNPEESGKEEKGRGEDTVPEKN